MQQKMMLMASKSLFEGPPAPFQNPELSKAVEVPPMAKS